MVKIFQLLGYHQGLGIVPAVFDAILSSLDRRRSIFGVPTHKQTSLASPRQQIIRLFVALIVRWQHAEVRLFREPLPELVVDLIASRRRRQRKTVRIAENPRRANALLRCAYGFQSIPISTPRIEDKNTRDAVIEIQFAAPGAAMSMSIDEPLDDELSGEIHDGDGGRIIRSLAADDGDLSPSMTITESGIAGRPVPSISVAPVNTVAVVGALC